MKVEGDTWGSFSGGAKSANAFFSDLAARFNIEPAQLEEMRRRLRESAKTMKSTIVEEL